MHRVLAPAGVLPQAAERLDTRRELWPDETRVRVERLNLDAASFRQLEAAHDGDGDAVRAAVLDIVRTRGKMQNPVTGSGGMLIGVVEEVGPEATLGLAVGDRVATLVSLSLTPLVHRGRPRRAGTAAASRCPPTATPSSSAAASPRGCPTTSPPSWPSWSWTSAGRRR